MSENKYIDFDEYFRQGEPSKRESAFIWSTAIGLQAVDGLKTSQYLQETARRNIEGEITLAQAKELIWNYYEQKNSKTPSTSEMEEADRVSYNIAQLLSASTLDFSLFGLLQVHKNIFNGVFKFAGRIRDYNITKKEWVLRGDTVTYMYAQDLKSAIEYDLEQERQFNYGQLSNDDKIAHIAKFVACLWQIHPFPEGNTRTTAVFTIQYLRSLGFSVNNDVFANNSWYFRNALVRYSYKNLNGVSYEPKFLERFFRNLLLNEKWVLKNRYLIINPPEEYSVQPRLDDPASTQQAPSKHPASTQQAPSKLLSDNVSIQRLVSKIGNGEFSIKQIMEMLDLRDRPNFLNLYLNPAIQGGFVRMLYPDSPRHPRQKYLLTVKGMMLLNDVKIRWAR